MKTWNRLLPLLPVALLATTATAQVEMPVTSVPSTGLGITNFEPLLYSYQFIAPLASNLLCRGGDQFVSLDSPTSNEVFCTYPAQYTPSFSNRYFMSVFGPRMTSNSGIIDKLYDFHRGEDIVDGSSPADGSTMPDIKCMCDGLVYDIFDENDLPAGTSIEQTEEGRYVRVHCFSQFGGTGMGHVYTVYRHLSSINPALKENSAIARGAVIGKMGSSGVTEINHLHLSVQKRVGTGAGKYVNVHPMRLFNSSYNRPFNRHLLLTLDAAPTSTTADGQKKERANIFLLNSSNASADPDQNWATVRVAVPYKKANIRAIIIKGPSGYSEKVDFEQISEERDGNLASLDDPVVGKLKLYVLPFNRGHSAVNRFNSIKADLAIKYPEHPANSFPLLDTQPIFTIPAYILDIKAKGLPQGFDPSKINVYVVDIWGRAVKGGQ